MVKYLNYLIIRLYFICAQLMYRTPKDDLVKIEAYRSFYGFYVYIYIYIILTYSAFLDYYTNYYTYMVFIKFTY